MILLFLIKYYLSLQLPSKCYKLTSSPPGGQPVNSYLLHFPLPFNLSLGANLTSNLQQSYKSIIQYNHHTILTDTSTLSIIKNSTIINVTFLHYQNGVDQPYAI